MGALRISAREEGRGEGDAGSSALSSLEASTNVARVSLVQRWMHAVAALFIQALVGLTLFLAVRLRRPGSGGLTGRRHRSRPIACCEAHRRNVERTAMCGPAEQRCWWC